MVGGGGGGGEMLLVLHADINYMIVKHKFAHPHVSG